MRRTTIHTLAALALLATACEGPNSHTPRDGGPDTGALPPDGSMTDPDGGGTEARELRVATWNVGLSIDEDLPYVVERTPFVQEALVRADVDVLCLQEYWDAAAFAALVEAASDAFPDNVRSAPMPVPGTCTDGELGSLEACVGPACGTLSGGDLAECALGMCSAELSAVSDGCGSCLLGVVSGGGSAADIRGTCEGDGGPGFLFEGVFDVGILTNLDVLERESRMLDSYLVRSSVEYARVDSPLGEVHVFCTHLASRISVFGDYAGDHGSWEGEQAQQIDDVLAFVEEKTGGTGQVILAGDLNNGPAIDRAGIVGVWPEHYGRFVAAGFDNPYESQGDVACTACPDNTFRSADSDPRLIDHVLVRGVDDAEASYERAWMDTASILDGTVETHLSDHYGLVLTLSGCEAGCGGTPDAGPPPVSDAGPSGPPPCNPAGACCNDRDLGAITARYGAGMDVEYSDVAGGCGQSCALDADPATCTAACLGMQTMDAASDPCEACHVASVLCAISNCIGECIADPGAPACIACLCGANAGMVDCMGDFAECSGILNPVCG